MTPEEQRATLCKWAGWQEPPPLSTLCGWTNERSERMLTDPLEDLNAVRMLEQRMTDDEWQMYYSFLHAITKPNNYKVGVGCDEHVKAFISATATQRCEALLHVIRTGKLIDSEQDNV